MFYTQEMADIANRNAERHPWAKDLSQKVVDAAAPWLALSDDELWNSVFSASITRAWMVWSNGHCPACKHDVPMYTWEIKPFEFAWKVRCPHCRELFPKNDFAAYYRSGLDEHNDFQPARADRKLLFNTEHPDPADPLHQFGVDDGEGYVEGEKRWRFIGAYLIYGQWKRVIVDGARKLAAAYTISGDRRCARKAAVLLDRVADVYRTFDYATQGTVYERPGIHGYVSTWHDACEETRELVLAYDQVRDALDDAELLSFLSRKALQHKLGNSKRTAAEVRANIEDGILRDTLNNKEKVHSNYPRREATLLLTEAILGGSGAKEKVFADLCSIVETATAVDGVTGEKGLASYSAGVIQSLGMLIGHFARTDATLLPRLIERCPKLRQTFRFFIDTWCLEKYYPYCGDSGGFALPHPQYVGLALSKDHCLSDDTGFTYPLCHSMFTFLWQLYEATGDSAYAKLIYLSNNSSNNRSFANLPYDLFHSDPEGLQRKLKHLIDTEGAGLGQRSTNKQEWKLAILRSGEGEHRRALWLDYDSDGKHSHQDGLNLGLFARGLDLMPDFGYPPVQYGGWDSKRANWYKHTAAHNTVLVDGKTQKQASGTSSLFADGTLFHAVRASIPGAIDGDRYERAVLLIDIDAHDFYAVDVFHVRGGSEHLKLMHSHFGTIACSGANLNPADPVGHPTLMRSFMEDASPQQGWSADWKIADRFKLAAPGADIHLRYTDLTAGARAITAEKWISVPSGANSFNSTEEAWIPCAMVRRTSPTPGLQSTFVGTIEAYEGRPRIRSVERLKLSTAGDAHVALRVTLDTGERDVIAIGDAAGSHAVQIDGLDLAFDAEALFARFDSQGELRHLAVCRGRRASTRGVQLEFRESADLFEATFINGDMRVLTDNESAIRKAVVK